MMDRALLATYLTLVSRLAYSSTLNMEVTRSSEMSVDFQWTIRRCVPEDRTVHNHSCENRRSYIDID
jgi:hypothetical protein